MDWYAFADSVVLREPDRVVTQHKLDPSDPFFRDHFPGRPVLPGVLATEALLQAGRALLEHRVDDGDRWVLGSVRAMRFSRFLEPGQWLVADVRLLDLRDDRAKLAATCLLSEGDAVQAEAVEGLAKAASGRLELRPVRLALPHPGE
ncbi:MAG: 3-hydroxyacyl-ACP dehydratase FabZ family protein [Phycisphaerales bacterium]